MPAAKAGGIAHIRRAAKPVTGGIDLDLLPARLKTAAIEVAPEQCLVVTGLQRGIGERRKASPLTGDPFLALSIDLQYPALAHQPWHDQADGATRRHFNSRPLKFPSLN